MRIFPALTARRTTPRACMPASFSNSSFLQQSEIHHLQGFTMKTSILNSMTASVLALSATLLMLGGCAGTPPPVQKMAAAEATVKHADTKNTHENAAGELQIAIAKLDSAK